MKVLNIDPDTLRMQFAFWSALNIQQIIKEAVWGEIVRIWSSLGGNWDQSGAVSGDGTTFPVRLHVNIYMCIFDREKIHSFPRTYSFL